MVNASMSLRLAAVNFTARNSKRQTPRPECSRFYRFVRRDVKRETIAIQRDHPSIKTGPPCSHSRAPENVNC